MRQLASRPVVIAGWLLSSAVAVGALALLGWPAQAYRDFDFFPFWAAGRLILVGADPYDADTLRAAFISGGSLGHAFGGPFAYPLPAAVLSIPYALLPFAIAAPLWLVSQVALSAAALWALARHLFGPDLRRDAPVLFTLLAAMPATLQTYAIGNVGGFLLAVVAGALVLLMGERPMRAGAVLGFGVFKPHVFLVLVPALLVRSRHRVRIALGGAATALGLVLVSFVVRPGWLRGWLASVSAVQAKEVAQANAWGPFPADARWVGWIVLVLLAAIVIWWWWRVRPSVAQLYAVAVALSLLAAPYVWTHYFTMLGVPIAVVLAAAPRRGIGRAAVLAALALVTVFVPWLLYVQTYRTGDEPYGGIVPLTLVILIVALVRPRLVAPEAGRTAAAAC